jgi:RNase H-fold protein (predicted Holliday junction resolvase)
VHLVDERLTTIEAERDLAAAGRAGIPVASSRDLRDAGQVDAYAAKLILETWLNDRD